MNHSLLSACSDVLFRRLTYAPSGANEEMVGVGQRYADACAMGVAAEIFLRSPKGREVERKAGMKEGRKEQRARGANALTKPSCREFGSTLMKRSRNISVV